MWTTGVQGFDTLPFQRCFQCRLVDCLKMLLCENQHEPTIWRKNWKRDMLGRQPVPSVFGKIQRFGFLGTCWNLLGHENLLLSCSGLRKPGLAVACQFLISEDPIKGFSWHDLYRILQNYHGESDLQTTLLRVIATLTYYSDIISDI